MLNFLYKMFKILKILTALEIIKALRVLMGTAVFKPASLQIGIFLV